MPSRADFHCHSTASDGVHSPAEVVRIAYEHGVRILALTDHDSTEGVAEAREAAKGYPGLTLIPGVEMGTDIPGAEVHVVGLFLEPDNRALQETLARLRAGREGRGLGMVQKLRELGFDVTFEQVKRFADGGSVGRPHVAAALLEKGYVRDIKEAFDKYIGRNGPAYVEREKMTPAEAVETIVRLGGVATLCHPADLRDLDGVLRELKAAGLSAVEVYYKDYPPETVERLRQAAERFGLIPSGGSDFHGIHGPDEPWPGEMHNNLPESSIEAIVALGRERARNAAK